jgi:hypothetical protein
MNCDSIPALSPRYALAQGERDGFPAIAMINTACSDHSLCAEYPWLLSIQIDMRESTEQGFPTDAEAAVLNEIEDRIEHFLHSATPFHHIARQTWNGLRLIDYYVSDGRKAQATIEALGRDNSLDRTISVSIKEDPAWRDWMPTLESMGSR